MVSAATFWLEDKSFLFPNTQTLESLALVLNKVQHNAGKILALCWENSCLAPEFHQSHLQFKLHRKWTISVQLLLWYLKKEVLVAIPSVSNICLLRERHSFCHKGSSGGL